MATGTEQWHWTEGGRAAGPGSEDRLAERVAGGRVGADELVWCEGMANWLPVRDVPDVARYLPAVAAAAAAVARPFPTPAVPFPPVGRVSSGELGYYSNTGVLPPRAAEALRGHAAPAGDVGDWPLDDARFQQLVETMKVRKPIVAAAGLFRGLFALYLIGLVIVAIGSLAVLGNSRRSAPAELVGFLTLAAVFGGLAALCWFAARATARSQRWAPVTMLVLFLIGFAGSVVAIVAASLGGNATPALIANGVTLLFAGLFAATAGRAVTAIPKYLRQPAWCQEVLARVERRK